MSTKKIYTDGFLEGMRYCGWLLADIPNEALALKKEVAEAVDKTFNEKKYSAMLGKMHKVITESVMESEDLKERIEQLERQLRLEKSTARFWHTVAIRNGLTEGAPVEN